MYYIHVYIHIETKYFVSCRLSFRRASGGHSLSVSLTLSLALPLSRSPEVPLNTAPRQDREVGLNTRGEPLSSKYSTHKTVKARFWPWLAGRTP